MLVLGGAERVVRTVSAADLALPRGDPVAGARLHAAEQEPAEAVGLARLHALAATVDERRLAAAWQTGDVDLLDAASGGERGCGGAGGCGSEGKQQQQRAQRDSSPHCQDCTGIEVWDERVATRRDDT